MIIDWSVVISLVALSGTAFTYIVHDKKLKRQEKLINEYQLEKIKAEKIEQQKAAIKAKFVKENGKTKIRVYNSGLAKAKNINLISNECEEIIIFMDGLFPYKYLNPGESIDIILVLTESSPDTLELKLTWDDDFKWANEYDQILQV